jgi:hypothetical protein
MIQQSQQPLKSKMVWTTVVVGMKLEAWIAQQPGIRIVVPRTLHSYSRSAKENAMH